MVLIFQLFNAQHIRSMAAPDGAEIDTEASSSIANLSFSVPKFDKGADYVELCNQLLKLLIPPDGWKRYVER